MLPCIDCKNPCADLWRWQCAYDGPGYAPCEERDRRERRILKIAIAALALFGLGSAAVAVHYIMALSA